ncbi:MAG TPA: hypothetical protein VHZ52_11550 [Acidobacteriaceae bacterium]|nr:hypothetical protein [Acidobacteriaceae bacterium]
MAYTDKPVGEENPRGKASCTAIVTSLIVRKPPRTDRVSTIFRRRTASIVHDPDADFPLSILQLSHFQHLGNDFLKNRLPDHRTGSNFGFACSPPAKTKSGDISAFRCLTIRARRQFRVKITNQQLIDRSDFPSPRQLDYTLRCGLPSRKTVLKQSIEAFADLFRLCLSLNLPQIEPQGSTFL